MAGVSQIWLSVFGGANHRDVQVLHQRAKCSGTGNRKSPAMQQHQTWLRKYESNSSETAQINRKCKNRGGDRIALVFEWRRIGANKIGALFKRNQARKTFGFRRRQAVGHYDGEKAVARSRIQLAVFNVDLADVTKQLQLLPG